jgi:hypothetical protein
MTDDTRIKYLGDVQRLALKPGDIIVVSVDAKISAEMAHRMHALVRDVVGKQHEVLIISDGARIGVLSPEDAA